MSDAVFKQFNFRPQPLDDDTMSGLTEEGLAREIYDQALAVYQQREDKIGSEELRHLERLVMLQTVDNLWKDHLLSMDHLKEGIGLRGYAQQNPLLVYKKEGFELFQDLIERIKEETLGIMFRIQLAEPESLQDMQRSQEQDLVFSGSDGAPPKKKPAKRQRKKVGRNDPCPCGSGKKYKKCHGK
jgi:preprotein translocase subunit SecA